MKKIILLAIMILIVLLGVLVWNFLPKNQGQDDLSLTLYKGISNAVIPWECVQYRDYTCSLFGCMVDLCWCFPDESSGVLQEGKITVGNEEEAINIVKQYVENENSEYNNVKRATKLNNVFYNVFAYDAQNNEEVFTVAADGTIIKTVCGV